MGQKKKRASASRRSGVRVYVVFNGSNVRTPFAQRAALAIADNNLVPTWCSPMEVSGEKPKKRIRGGKREKADPAVILHVATVFSSGKGQRKGRESKGRQPHCCDQNTHKLELARPGVEGGMRMSSDSRHHVVDALRLEPSDCLFVCVDGDGETRAGLRDLRRVSGRLKVAGASVFERLHSSSRVM